MSGSAEIKRKWNFVGGLFHRQVNQWGPKKSVEFYRNFIGIHWNSWGMRRNFTIVLIHPLIGDNEMFAFLPCPFTAFHTHCPLPFVTPFVLFRNESVNIGLFGLFISPLSTMLVLLPFSAGPGAVLAILGSSYHPLGPCSLLGCPLIMI